jgi:transcriptional regulator with XRE-family HTH domain
MLENINILVGERIKYYRKSKNLSQEKLANIAEIERGYMSGIENGKRNVSIIILEKIITALEIDFAVFFNDEKFKG